MSVLFAKSTDTVVMFLWCKASRGFVFLEIANTLLPASFTEDLNGNTRIVGGLIDMGAFEYDPTLSTEVVSARPLDFTIYPNPAKTLFVPPSPLNLYTRAPSSLISSIL